MNTRGMRRQLSVLVTALQAVLLAAMLAAPGTFARYSSQATPAALSGLESAVQSGLDAGLPGIALLVERNGERVASMAAGVASVENQTPVTTANRFRIYSIAKTFTATVVLQLVDEGILALDDTVVDWLADPAIAAIPNVERITLRQLLTHTSGIYDFADDNDSSFWADAFLGPDADWAKVWTLPELLAYADGANHAPYFAPGEGWAYSNTGYLLLGMIVEAATGNAYGDELRARILEPLGLHDTTLAEGGAMPGDIVDGYQLVDGQRLNVSETNLSWIWTGGGMISTTEDLARFAQATFAGELLSPASFAEMFTFLPTDKPTKGEGMGVYSIATPNGTLIGMDGAGPGGESSMMHLPEADITVIVLANLAPAGAIVEGLRDEVFRLALAGDATPAATPDTVLEIPPTVTGDHLTWLLELLNTAAATADSDDVGAHFTPAALAQIPAEALIATVHEFSDAFGPFSFAGLARPAASNRLVGYLSGRDGGSFVVVVGAEAVPPYRLTGVAILPAPPPSAMPPVAPESLSGRFDVGGRAIFLSCSGSESPTVILETGYGDSSGLWAPVQNGVAPLTRVCVYDRANVSAGVSDPAETPRTAADQVSDLHALLAAAAVPGPYIIGAHSYSGLIARLYAATYPEEVAGLVLVDTVHEDRATRRQGLVSPEQWAEAQELEAQFSDFEQIDQEGSWQEVRTARAAAPLPAMPLVVFAAGDSIDPSYFPPGWPIADEVRLHRELQEDLAGLVPNGRYLLVAGSGHYIQLDQPELVIDAIGDVVAAVREIGPAATAIGGTPATDTRSGANLDDVLQGGLDQGLTGVALHIEQGDEVIFDRAAGLTSIETGTSLAPSDRFRIYSITKTFTAILILQLVDDGILSLDDTVTDWLDASEVLSIPNIDQITLRQLLTHTSGVYDYFDSDSPFWQDAYLGEGADWSRVWTPRELLAYADGARHAAYFAPGTGAHYSNTGYVLLGLIVEEATGQQFAERLHDTILEPLGLRDTFFAATEPVRGGAVDGYHLIDGELVNVSATHLSAQWAAGGMVSTTRDLAHFADAVFRGEFLGPDSMREMFTFVPSEKPGIDWGMGVARMQTGAGELVGMAGDGPGFSARMFRLPVQDLTLMLLSNTGRDDESATVVLEDAIRAALESMP